MGKAREEGERKDWAPGDMLKTDLEGNNQQPACLAPHILYILT